MKLKIIERRADAEAYLFRAGLLSPLQGQSAGLCSVVGRFGKENVLALRWLDGATNDYLVLRLLGASAPRAASIFATFLAIAHDPNSVKAEILKAATDQN